MDEIWEGGVGEKKVSGRILGLRLVGLHQAPPKFVLLLPSTPSTCNKHVKYNLPNRSLWDLLVQGIMFILAIGVENI